MPTPTENAKGTSRKGAKWLWSIPFLVAVFLILNHHYQWYTWPWVETTPPAKVEKKVIQEPTSPPAKVEKEMAEEPTSKLAKVAKKVTRELSSRLKKVAKRVKKVLSSGLAKVSEKLTQQPSSPPAEVAKKITKGPPPAPAKVETKVAEESAPKPVIDYEKIKEKSDKGMKELVRKRKKEFGVDKSVDMVVASGEQIRVGKEIIPLDRILAEIKAQKKALEASVTTPSRPVKPDAVPLPPEIQESTRAMQAKPDAGPLSPETRVPRRPMPARPAKKPVSYYGVYVVRPGDNLWNIHFAFLGEYFGSRGIPIPSDADEPHGSKSSGVGRILKYAETMVYIFNLKTRTLSTNLNLLEPKEKIVIFNLSALNKALAPLTYEQIDRVHFDGRDLSISEQ
ncbi:MAG: hypothetical protein ISS61_10480 [Desulfobacteraceae bacterium]|nr:hypothetical protein [Desulfobacteraceae bacterium]